MALALISLTLMPSVTAHAEQLLVHPARYPSQWGVDVGGEFPGATGEMSVVEDERAGTCLEGRFRFGGESRYSGLKWQGEIPHAQAVGFRVKTVHHDGVGLRVRDATGQEHAGGSAVTKGEWTEVEVPLTPEHFRNHWSGADDGEFHFPLTAVLVSLSRGPDESSLRLSDLYVVTEHLDPADRWKVSIEPGVPSGVAFRGERVEYTIRVLNCINRQSGAELRVESQEYGGKPREVGRWPLEIEGWQHTDISFRLPSRQPGYWCLRAALSDAQVGELPQVVSGLVVVPRPRHYGRPAPDCYFGIQSVQDMEAAERLGAKAIRSAPGWRWAEAREGQILDRYIDGAVNAAVEHHMAVLLTLQAHAPGWAAWQVEDRPQLAGLPAPERLGDWQRFCRYVAERVRGKATVIEVQNEPDLTCWRHPGLSFEEGVDYYVNLLQAAHDGIREVDPEVPIAGLDVSGGDFETGLRYTGAVLDKAADLLDLYTGHPYASPRYFGPGNNPRWPIQNRMAEKCVEALDLFERHGRPRRMWIGELGWGLLNTLDPLDDHSLDFAACVARSMIVGKTVPGVEKNLYFTFAGCNEHGNEYGLVRGSPLYPLPAALAYATAAYLLDAAAPVALERAGGQLWRCSFACEKRDELIVVWWTEGEAVALRPPEDAPGGRWIDSFCRRVKPGKRGVKVARLPVYWVLPLGEGGQRPDSLDDVRIEAPSPVSVGQVFVTSLDRLALVLTNNTSVPQRVEVEIDGRKQPLRLEAGERMARHEVELPSALPVGQPKRLQVAVTAGNETRKHAFEVVIQPLPLPPAGFAADADLGEWASARELRVADRDAVLPPDPNIGWDGPDDLSLRAYLAADDRGLYFAAAVTDDVHAAPACSASNFWTSDSIQLAIDPANDSAEEYDDDDREIGFALGEDGPHAFLTYPLPGGGLDIPVTIRRLDGTTTYEAFVPWEAIGTTPPAPGELLAINFIANENDGQGRAYWMGLTPGIGESKSPISYRRFVRMGN
jgi:hypothetical protein